MGFRFLPGLSDLEAGVDGHVDGMTKSFQSGNETVIV